MKNLKICSLIVLLCGVITMPTMAGGFDGTQKLICSISEVVECGPDGKCQQPTAGEVGMPDLIKIDFAGKTISAANSSEDKRTTPIENIEKIDGKIIIQGAEDGLENARDGVGWSLAIMEETGKMVLTASGDEVGFMLFGACTPD